MSCVFSLLLIFIACFAWVGATDIFDWEDDDEDNNDL